MTFVIGKHFNKLISDLEGKPTSMFSYFSKSIDVEEPPDPIHTSSSPAPIHVISSPNSNYVDIGSSIVNLTADDVIFIEENGNGIAEARNSVSSTSLVVILFQYILNLDYLSVFNG